jgi:hypothetical protein
LKDQVIKAALNWVTAIETRSPENVIRLYHSDAVLWGTLAKDIRHGHENIKSYFIKFLKRDSLTCRFISGEVRLYGDFAFYSGAYEFTWRITDLSITVPARFTFIFKNEKGNWLILEHHSSLYPDQQFKLKEFIIQNS